MLCKKIERSGNNFEGGGVGVDVGLSVADSMIVVLVCYDGCRS